MRSKTDVGTPALRCTTRSPFKPSILGIGGKNGKLRRKTPVLHLEYGFHHVRDVFRAKFRRVLFLGQSGSLVKTCQDFARVDKEYPDVMLPQLRTPAFRHSAKSEFAAIVGCAFWSPAQRGGRGDVYDVSALPLHENFCGFAGHQHRSRYVCRKHSLEFLAIEIYEILEHAGAGIVHENVKIAEFFQ